MEVFDANVTSRIHFLHKDCCGLNSFQMKQHRFYRYHLNLKVDLTLAAEYMPVNSVHFLYRNCQD